jgi:cephalosporin-C deacetylase
MKKLIFAMVLAGCLVAGLQGQNLLRYTWKFSTGDDPVWASPGFDDSGWKTIQAGTDWENQGYGTYDGFAWYRQTLSIPSSLKEAAEAGGGFILSLGTIDDADVTYWNGEFLGRTGGMPPEYETGYNQLRKYSIPPDRIIWDGENTIAVRVFDGGGGGGIVSGPVGLSVKGLDRQVVVKAVMERDDHLFLNPGPVRFSVTVENKLDVNLKGELVLGGRSDFGEEMVQHTYDLKVRPGELKKIPVDLGELEPGFYRLSATLESESDNQRADFAIGVRPEEISSPLDREDDFGDFWMRAKRELAAVDPQFRLIRQEQYCTDTREVYLLEMRSLCNVLIRGWYMRPVREGKYPAILSVQGYSSVKSPADLYRGDDMVNLALNIRGHGNSRDQVDPGFPGYILYHVEDRETYVYRGAYMDCVRAVDFLFSREEVDTTRVAVEGGSQGGALSFATAALDNKRIALCIPEVPFLSDFRDYFRVAAWPAGEFFDWFKAHPEVPEDDIYRNLSYFDIKNLAPWIKAPVFMAVGLKDTTCPPHINFAAYNQLKVPRQYVAYPESGHSLPGEYYGLMIEYIRKHFNLD